MGFDLILFACDEMRADSIVHAGCLFVRSNDISNRVFVNRSAKPVLSLRGKQIVKCALDGKSN